jgi:hypothetical protein
VRKRKLRQIRRLLREEPDIRQARGMAVLSAVANDPAMARRCPFCRSLTMMNMGKCQRTECQIKRGKQVADDFLARRKR